MEEFYIGKIQNGGVLNWKHSKWRSSKLETFKMEEFWIGKIQNGGVLDWNNYRWRTSELEELQMEDFWISGLEQLQMEDFRIDKLPNGGPRNWKTYKSRIQGSSIFNLKKWSTSPSQTSWAFFFLPPFFFPFFFSLFFSGLLDFRTSKISASRFENVEKLGLTI